MNEKMYLEKIKLFVEGKLNIDEMVKLCKEDKGFREFAKDFQDNSLRKYKNSFLYFIDNANMNLPTCQLTLYLVLSWQLVLRKITFVDTDYYIKKAQDYAEVIPDWLPDSAVDWVDDNLLSQIPQDWSKAKRKKWLKEQLEKIYPCEKKKPSWVQGTDDWPKDKEGNNLTFVKQKEKGEQVTYTFVDPKTNEETEIVEFY